jgi:hypothetical protein
MQPYNRDEGNPAFEVRYCLIPYSDGGREQPPKQHIRWDFLYEEDDPSSDGISMVWPEFVDENGKLRSENDIPIEGIALMFIVDPARRGFHKKRIAVGVRGFFMEGSRKVGKCEVTAVLGLASNDQI